MRSTPCGFWPKTRNCRSPPPHAEILARADIRDELKEGGFLIRVPLIEDDTRTVRANITMEAGTLAAIDMAAKERGLTRSAFLASCARKEIERSA